jgi:hypothetical protein
VATQKFAPAPPTAQNSSGFSFSLADAAAVGQHQLDRPQVVNGKAMAAGQQPDSAGGGEPADAGAAIVA